MKKQLQKLMLCTLMTASLGAMAQPILTSANTDPAVGDIFVLKNSTATVSPGSSGANQTWNLTGLTSASTSNYTVTTAAATPSGSSFPSANVCASDGNNYSYYDASATSWQNYGMIAGGVVFSYSDPETMLTFPFNYTSTFTDPWACTFFSGVSFNRNGTTTVTADGYGTATTPAGTYSNVMRVHVVQSYTDAATGFTLTYVNDEYMWFKTGTHYPVALTYTLTTGGNASIGGAYLNNFTAGLNNYPAMQSGISLFPNPAVNEITLNCQAQVGGNAVVKVLDVEAKHIKTLSALRLVPGNNSYKFNINDLAPGVYFLQVYSEGIILKNERFVVTK